MTLYTPCEIIAHTLYLQDRNHKPVDLTVPVTDPVTPPYRIRVFLYLRGQVVRQMSTDLATDTTYEALTQDAGTAGALSFVIPAADSQEWASGYVGYVCEVYYTAGEPTIYKGLAFGLANNPQIPTL